MGRALEPPLAAATLLAVLPLFLLVALAVRISSPGPALVRRRVRVTTGRWFDALEFRTTFVGAGGALGPRPTPIGRLLRRTALHRLPHLIDVARGRLRLADALRCCA